MDWYRINDRLYKARAGIMSIETRGWMSRWRVWILVKVLTVMLDADYASAASAKRAALRWAKRLQEGLK